MGCGSLFTRLQVPLQSWFEAISNKINDMLSPVKDEQVWSCTSMIFKARLLIVNQGTLLHPKHLYSHKHVKTIYNEENIASSIKSWEFVGVFGFYTWSSYGDNERSISPSVENVSFDFKNIKSYQKKVPHVKS